ncbi:hypothetical protein [Flavobacterium cellulosilyticum]|uniref:Beta-lactamase-inhibitor-like PepSY-like domain-containing protein n=1 Tax=Flavobacterium cellulosilyticum TaxID=2541731 RepID=A0A4R5CLR7_9FLAO|nr:hypothetical protein [Flavobacterium cellulosilyticum]TDD99343.1 hypothetical protein E0F76_01030 [Flavobacterium cellulosilyticum]
MKKLILSAAIILGSFTTFAQAVESTPVEQQAKVQDEYTEISMDKLPEAVTKATEATYPGSKIKAAYMNKQNQYKLELTVKDQSATVFADADGNWITK